MYICVGWGACWRVQVPGRPEASDPLELALTGSCEPHGSRDWTRFSVSTPQVNHPLPSFEKTGF